MKRSVLPYVLISCAFILFLVNPAKTQDDCEVLLDDIAGEYEGDCKKGLASGQGTAKGKDTYIGEFKKGLPNGEGTYTWANGDIYEGEFKKGEKEGKGKLLISQSNGEFMERNGYWLHDEYIGEYESPYKLQYRSAGVTSVTIKEMENPDNDGNALFVEFQNKGRTQSFPEYDINLITGNFHSRVPFNQMSKILVVEFPIGFRINYMNETVELLFYQARSWHIRIDLNK